MIKEIEDFEGYFVSEDGKIFSAHKQAKGIVSDEMHELKPDISKNGYAGVGLYKDGKLRGFLVHRLVAKAFIPNPENKPEVNHIDR